MCAANYGGDINVSEGDPVQTKVGEGVMVMNENDLLEWAVKCLVKAGTAEEQARTQAIVLLEADKRGHYSHGLNRLWVYVRDIQEGACRPNNAPEIVQETLASALVDGKSGLGAVVAEFSMKLTIKKAKEAGVGWVSVKNSNHFGIAGHYSGMAEREGLVGFAFTNGSPWVTATRAKGDRVLSTNPISMAAPAGQEGDCFLLDMATSAVAAGKIEVAAVNDGEMPAGWAVDREGKETTDPMKALREGAGLPLGGLEETGGYKGYGLAMMVEVLCGIMTGGPWGPQVRKWGLSDSPGGISHCFLALDPRVCGPGFPDRLSNMMEFFRGLMPASPNKPVLVPGDPERLAKQVVREQGGVSYTSKQFQRFTKLSEKIGVPTPDYKDKED